MTDPIATEVATTNRVYALAFFIAAATYYGLLIFRFLPATQFDKYPEAAALYLSGKLPPERLLDFSFAYLCLHILVQKLFENATMAITILQIVAMSASISMFFLLLNRFYSLRIAVGSALLFLLTPALVIYTQIFEPEPFLMLSMISFLWFVLHKSRRMHLIGGICFAFGTLIRPNFLPVAAVVLLHFFWMHHGPERKNKWVASSFVFLLPVIIGLGGVWVRNTMALGYFSSMVMNPGTTVYEGNNPTSKGVVCVYPLLFDELLKSGEPDYQHVLYRTFARRIANKNLSVTDVNKYWSGKVRIFWLDNPGRLPGHLALKLFHFFHSYDWHDLINAHVIQWKIQALRIPYIPMGFVSVMAFAGMLSLRGRFKEFILFYTVLFVQLAVILSVYVSGRQRMAVLFILFFFAAAAADSWIRSRRSLVIGTLISLLGGLLLHTPSDQIREEKHLWRNLDLSKRLMAECYHSRERGELLKAADLALRARALSPWLPDSGRPAGVPWPAKPLLAAGDDFSSRFDTVLVEIQEKQIEFSPQILKDLIEGNYKIKRDQYVSSEPRYYLSQIAMIQGNRDDEKRLLLEAMHFAPGDPWILASLYATSSDPQYKKLLFRYFDDIDANFILGKAFYDHAMYKEAAAAFQIVTSEIPEFRRGWIYLAASTRHFGDLQQAVAYYQRALQMRFEPVILEKEILPLFRKFAEVNTGSITAQFAYGIVLRQFGQCQEALRAQQRALNLDPANQQILSEIQALEKVLPACSAKN